MLIRPTPPLFPWPTFANNIEGAYELIYTLLG